MSKQSGLQPAIGCFFGQLITEGISITVQVLYPGLIRKYEASYFEISLIGSFLAAFFLCLSPISQFLVNQTSHRTVVIISGSLAALGALGAAFAGSYLQFVCMTIAFGIPLGIAYMPSLTAAAQHFTGWRQHVVIVSGTVGGGLGSLLFPAVFGWIANTEPIAMSFVALACILLNLVVCGALMFPVPVTVDAAVDDSVWTVSGGVKPLKERQSRRVSVRKSPARVFKRFANRYKGQERTRLSTLFICNFAWCAGSFAFLATLSLSLASDGYSDAQIAHVFILMGAIAVIGRLLAIGLAVFNIKTLVYFSSTVLSGVAVAPLLVDKTYTTYCVVSTLYGFFLGVQCAIIPSVCIHFFAEQNAEHAMSIALLACGSAAIVGPPLAGIVLDAGGSFEAVFGAESVVIIAAGFVLLPNTCLSNIF